MAVDVNDPERINFLRSIMEIYPHGEFVSTMVTKRIERVKKEKGIDMDYSIINQLVYSKLAYERDIYHTINFVKKKNPDTGNQEDYVIITNTGKQAIWSYAQYLYENNPFEYIRWLIDWVERGDEIAKSAYDDLLQNEVVNYIDLMSSIVSPTTFEEAARSVILLRDIDTDDRNQINALLQDMQKFLERAIALGLVHKEMSSQPVDDGGGNVSVQQVSFFRLTSAGIRILNDLYGKISDSTPSDFSPMKINREGLLNESQKVALVSLLISAIVFMIGMHSISSMIFFGSILQFVLGGFWDKITEIFRKRRKKG